MTVFSIYIPAAVTAAFASFIFGAIWYGALSKQWMAAANVSEEQAGMSLAKIVLLIACQLMIAVVLALFMTALGQVTLLNGLYTGATAWLGFVLTTMAINYTFQNAPSSLMLIDSGHWLIALMLQGALYGWISSTFS
ncbi:DUF1761 domain-containing protein [Polycladidibacter hongkongensis]|uniref:DUF1761 domain-containing protein n=1 Tax=Polycladidibacter hongkongensis TaxID=1647556 RepID=UPI00082CF889|nr:DUF1761 domain-containing protein [Pseudovibrio hongkongensis]